LNKAQKSLKICVFNFTNNDLAAAVLDRHKKGVNVRIITDDECMENLGSDIRHLAENGVPCRTDNAK
jgi:cardiolipin hydrolase